MSSSVSGSLGESASSSSSSSSIEPGLARKKLPITSIPDMRFENSYLASIRGFVHEVNQEAAVEIKQDRVRRNSNSEMRDPISTGRRHVSPSILASRSRSGEPELWLGRIRIEWFPLLYLTVRDQILSPIIQGAVFGVGGLALGHLRAFLVARRRNKAGAAN